MAPRSATLHARLVAAIDGARQQFGDASSSTWLARAGALDDERQPAWPAAFRCFFDAQAHDGDEGEAASTLPMLRGIESTARALVPMDDGTVSGVPVTGDGYQGMVEDLARRLLEVCDAVLSVELLAMGRQRNDWTDLVQLDSSQDVWLARVEAYPGLPYVIGTACAQWRAGLEELLARWRVDAARVCNAWSHGGAPGALAGFTGGAGDRHHHGRSVALLRFSSGLGVVYKPKELALADASMRLFVALNEVAGEPLLPVRGVLCGDGYGWEERVEPTPVADVAEFDAFYRRLGALTRVLQHLGARDMWADNLVAVGSEPHFVDLECVLFAPLDVDGDDPAWTLAVRADQTVVRTAIPLAATSPGFGLYAPDVGCLSHAGDPRERGGGGIPLGPYRPWTSHVTADPWDHAEAVLDGYAEADRVLRAHQVALLEPDGVLAAFRDSRVRYIARSTWEYQRLLAAYLGATALADASVWSRLDEAVRGAVVDGDESARGEAIADSECDALRNLDIPLFTTLAGRGSLYTAAGDELPGSSSTSSWAQLMERTRALHAFPLDAELAVLRAAIDAARGAGSTDWRREDALVAARASPSDLTTPLSRDEVASHLAALVETIEAARLPPLGDGRGWLALTWSPTHDVVHVGPAGADLSGGALGPALLLAEYASVAGDRRAADSCVAVLVQLDQMSDAPFAQRLEARFELNAWPVGGIAGPGALVHVAARAAAHLGSERLDAIVERQLRRATTLLDTSPFGLGLATGLAGLHVQLLGAFGVVGRRVAGLEALLRRCASTLVDAFGDPGLEAEPPDVAARLARVLPAGRDGVALALARTLDVAPHLLGDHRDVARALQDHRCSSSTFGGQLASLAISGRPAVAGLPDVVDPHVQALSTAALLARIALFQRVVQLGDGDDHAAACRRGLRELLDRRRMSGHWCPDRLVDDQLNLSALSGLPAIGRVLLRQLEPSLSVLSVSD